MWLVQLLGIVVNALKMADDPINENPLENYYEFWKNWTNQVNLFSNFQFKPFTYLSTYQTEKGEDTIKE